MHADGLVHKLIEPDGAFILFAHDAAQRLTGVEDALGNTITYRLDQAGDREGDEIRDASGVLRFTVDRVFNTLGELSALEEVRNGAAVATTFAYDAAGRLETVTDAHDHVTFSAYDALGRLEDSIANATGSTGEDAPTSFEYDALDRLTAVIDPKGLTTGYDYNVFGDLVELDSPDTGTTTYGHDAAGNRTTQLDARGVLSTYTYDRLNRLTLIDLPTTADTTFTYDALPTACQTEETFSVGQVSSFTDPSGSTTLCHDRRGNLVRKVQAVTSAPTDRTVVYAYDLADRVTGITYPSGASVTYTRDAAGRVTGVAAKSSPTATPVALLSDIDYLPFGPVGKLTWGNGRTLTKAYDQNYAIDAVTDSATGGLS